MLIRVFVDYKSEPYGETVVVSVYLTRATLKDAMAFRDYILDLIKKSNLRIIVDLSFCDYIDSTFLGALVASLKKISSMKGDLQLIYNNKASSMIFEMTNMNRVFKIHNTLNEALISFGEEPQQEDQI